ncbi:MULTISPECIES: hypothetical protein [unclassified Rhodococcus (in: high G+C Gram-positive bacteria)]|uniref:hypothetical protein n=1 Tax=unclassified Rhodococcus (in: high G+C Gram-positive bacteria) TaxID=192944 RepID=UPI000A83ADC2|nr:MULTISPECIES: hypothetical protein [unclassified Rhodococcus (in: high G+C Gram-positive bacteria)]
MAKNTTAQQPRTNTVPSGRTAAAIVTHTTAVVTGPQSAKITVTVAATGEAQMIVTFGHVMMTFRNAEAVCAVIAAFASIRAALVGADGHAPAQAEPGEEFGAAAISVLWL